MWIGLQYAVLLSLEWFVIEFFYFRLRTYIFFQYSGTIIPRVKRVFCLSPNRTRQNYPQRWTIWKEGVESKKTFIEKGNIQNHNGGVSIQNDNGNIDRTYSLGTLRPWSKLSHAEVLRVTNKLQE